MRKKIINKDGQPIECHEVEFVDMEHTLDWLIETAEKYCCVHTLEYLLAAKKLVLQKRNALFNEGSY